MENLIDRMKAANLDSGEQRERFVIYMYVTGSDTVSLTHMKSAVATTQRVNQRRNTESIVLFEMVNSFKMYVIKMKKYIYI